MFKDKDTTTWPIMTLVKLVECKTIRTTQTSLFHQKHANNNEAVSQRYYLMKIQFDNVREITFEAFHQRHDTDPRLTIGPTLTPVWMDQHVLEILLQPNTRVTE